MRFLLIFLVAANVGSYFWIQQTSGSKAGVDASPAFAHEANAVDATGANQTNIEATVASIKLLHEPEKEVITAAVAANHGEPEPENEAQEQESAGVVDTNGPLKESAGAARSLAADIAKRMSALKDQVAATANSPEIVEAQAPAPSPKDFNQNLNQDLKAAKAEASQLALNGPEGSLCWFVDMRSTVVATNKASSTGIIKDNGLEAIAKYISSVGIQADLVEVKVPKRLKYIVYVPQLESKSAALVRLRELLADGYDAFVFREGAYKNAISLGFYNNKDIAVKMREKFSAEGLEVELAPWESFKLDSRLRLDHENSSKLASGLWAAIEDRWDGALREKKYCDAIAQR